jgi:hypothetical protein
LKTPPGAIENTLFSLAGSGKPVASIALAPEKGRDRRNKKSTKFIIDNLYLYKQNYLIEHHSGERDRVWGGNNDEIIEERWIFSGKNAEKNNSGPVCIVPARFSGLGPDHLSARIYWWGR